MAHRRLLALTFIFPLASAASARGEEPAVQTAPAAERVAADSPKATPAGATFKVPAGWTIATRGSMTLLDPPETDSHLAIVDVEAKDADAAVAAAWSAFKPGFKRPLRIAQPQAAREGWDERRYFEYETSPNEKATVFAFAWRAGTAWTVTLVDASDPTFEKRGGPFSLVFASLRPKGYRARDVRGEEGAPDRREDDRDVEGVPRGRDEAVRRRGRRLQPDRRREGRLRGRARRQGARQIGPDRREHALHGRVEHEGDDDAPPRRARRREEAALGPARHRGPPGLQARRRGDDEAGPREAPHLRVHGHAAPGSRGDLRVRRRDAPLVDAAPRHDAADEQVRRGLPVQQHDGRGGRVHRRRSREPGQGAGHRVRRGDADEGLRPSRDDPHDVRLRAGAEGRSRAAARGGRGRQAGARANGPERADRAVPAGWRSLHERARPLEVRPDGAREGNAPGRQATRLRGEPSRAARAAGPRERGRHVRHGPVRRPQVGDSGRPPRRRPLRLPQRHDVAARPRRRSRHPGELGFRRQPPRAVPAPARRAAVRRKARGGGPDSRRRRAAKGQDREGARAPRRPGGRGRGRQAGAAVPQYRARRDRGEKAGQVGRLRRRRVAQRGGLAQERRRDDLLHHDRSDHLRLRVRRRRQRRQARARHARRAARVRFQGGSERQAFGRLVGSPRDARLARRAQGRTRTSSSCTWACRPISRRSTFPARSS